MYNGVKSAVPTSHEQRERIDAERIEAFIEQHGVALLGYARSKCGSATDAEDVYQRMLEAMVTSRPSVESDQQLFAWATRVISNEAIDDFRARKRRPEVELDEAILPLLASEDDPPELLAERDTHALLGEAIRRLRPDHARCLILRAEGFDYPRISEITGFSYAKVNRCLSEGRKSVRTKFARIDEGRECERLSGALSAYVDDSVSSESRADVELHLKNCLACSVRVREYRETPGRVAVALPVGTAALGSGGLHERIAAWIQKVVDGSQSGLASVQEQVAHRAASIYQVTELAGAKNAAIVVSVTASIAVGSAGVATVVSDDGNKTPSSQEPSSSITAPTADPAKSGDERPSRDDADKAKKKESSRAAAEPTTADVESPGFERQAEAQPRRDVPSGESAPLDEPQPDPGSEELDGDSGSSESPSDLTP